MTKALDFREQIILAWQHSKECGRGKFLDCRGVIWTWGRVPLGSASRL